MMHSTSAAAVTAPGSGACAPAKLPPPSLHRVALLCALGGLLPAQAATTNAPAIKTTLAASVSERYDGNLMLQNQGPLARLESFVTSVQPVIGADWTVPGGSTLKLGLQYAPEFTFFHERDEESYLRHNGVFKVSFKDAHLTANALAKAQFTDGSTDGPIWSTPDALGTTPALGASEVRYRRRNFYWQSPLDVRYDLPGTFVRGVFEARVWDIMTDFKIIPGSLYQNYVDRTDVNGGGDFGVKLGRGWEAAAGYRFGHQDQEQLPVGLPYTYQNDYHRVVGVLGASPVKWFKFGGEAGPSFHEFNPASLPADAEASETLFYFQANATFTLGKDTTLKGVAYQYLLPSTAGRANFQNIRATGTLDHRFATALRGALRFDLQEYDFVRGLNLRDQVYTVETRLEYAFNPRCSAAAWYAFEWAANLDPGITGREYDRHVVGLGLTVKR